MRQGTLLIVILITGILFWGGVFYFMFRPDNPGKRAVEVAELALKASVDNPESVIIELSVGPDDMGKVIGRQGRIAKEIRTVIRSYAQRTGEKVSVDIVD